MTGLRYTLLGDGASDRVLIHPIRWALRVEQVAVETGRWADLSRLRPRPASLADRIHRAIELYPAELLFVHRDAEGEQREHRLEEIRTAVGATCERHVPVVPVRMTEAWLLHDEAAIRRASGNPNGRTDPGLPRPEGVERLSDPKETLRCALLEASELPARRRRRLATRFGDMRARTAELIGDFAPLRAAPAFAALLMDLRAALGELGHSRP